MAALFAWLLIALGLAIIGLILECAERLFLRVWKALKRTFWVTAEKMYWKHMARKAYKMRLARWKVKRKKWERSIL